MSPLAGLLHSKMNFLVAEPDQARRKLIHTTIAEFTSHPIQESIEEDQLLRMLKRNVAPTIFVFNAGLQNFDTASFCKAIKQMHGRNIFIIAMLSLDNVQINHLFDEHTDEIVFLPLNRFDLKRRITAGIRLINLELKFLEQHLLINNYFSKMEFCVELAFKNTQQLCDIFVNKAQGKASVNSVDIKMLYELHKNLENIIDLVNNFPQN